MAWCEACDSNTTSPILYRGIKLCIKCYKEIQQLKILSIKDGSYQAYDLSITNLTARQHSLRQNISHSDKRYDVTL